MALPQPAPLCVVSADAAVRRHLAEVLGGQGHRVVQADGLGVLAVLARDGIAAAVVDPRLPGLGGDPLGRLRSEPVLHGRPVILLRDGEIATLGGASPEAALVGLVLRVSTQLAGDAHLDLLNDVSGALTAERDLRSTMRNILDVVAARVKADTATLFVVGDDGRLEARAALGYDLELASLRSVDIGEGVVGWVAAHRHPTIVGDSSLDGRFAGRAARSPRSMLAVPILIGHRVLGAVTLVRRAPSEQFADADLVLVGTISNYAGIALEAARVHEDERAVRAHLAEVEETLREERVFLGRLEEYDRLYTQVVATVSHELKTPLMGIRGFAQLIADGGLSADEVRDFAREIQDNAVRLSRYVEGILDEDAVHSGRVTLEPRPVALEPLVRQVLRSVAPTASPAHHLVADVPADLPEVHGDPDKLLQVLTNLVSNAVKYSPEGGAVTVSAAAEGGRILLAVEDEGLGIPEDARPRVFDRFYRVPGANSRRIGGTGLGLSIVRSLVELHGGTIGVHPGRGGRGSRFSVTLPAATASLSAAIVELAAAEPRQAALASGAGGDVVELAARGGTRAATEASIRSRQRTRTSLARLAAVRPGPRPAAAPTDLGPIAEVS